MKMRTMLILTLLSVSLLVAGTGIAGAGVVDTGSIPASATLTGVNTLRVEAVIYDGDPTTSINFGTITPPPPDFKTPGEYIKVVHDDNSLVWEIKIYTDNFGADPSTTTWGYNYGGMIGGTPGARLSMGWHAGIADSASSAFAVGTATDSVTTGWNFLKDKRDKNIPDTEEDESWLGEEGDARYANVAYGSPDKQYVIDPREGEAGHFRVEDDNKTFVVEVEGMFGSAPGDSYSTTISFDLVHP